jgi:sugar/nucleoside kinase (ribokinase family)
VYHGVFLYGILQGYPLETTALYASAAGAITATKLGGRLSAPTMGEIKQLLQEWAN